MKNNLSLHTAARWLLLAALSAAIIAVWERAGLPASLLMGSMLAGIILAVRGLELRMPAGLFLYSQGLVGAMMAHNIPLNVFDQLGASWPLFLGGTVWAIGASLAIGWILVRCRILPGTTAIWGISPGAASAMVLMSEDYGADMRLVAFIQYLRVVFVSLAAALVAHFWSGGLEGGPVSMNWFPSLNFFDFLITVIFVAVTVRVGIKLKIPGGPILLPFILGMIGHYAGWLYLELPPWLMVISYAVIGWSIGLRFTTAVLKNAVKALPQIVLALTSLIAVCAFFGLILVMAADIDPLTAYLATSPGGVDTVAIIAASTPVDLPFIMTMQSMRMILVFFISPALTRRVTSKMNFRP